MENLKFTKEETERYISIKFDKINIIVRIYDDNFNRVQFDDGLEYLTDIELGVQVYKSLINEFGYICSNPYLGKIPIECEMVWLELALDKDFYIFAKDEVLIIFDKKYNLIKMKSKLRNFFREFYISRSVFDDDFKVEHPNLFKYIKKKMLDC
jgi:hypothetical protein